MEPWVIQLVIVGVGTLVWWLLRSRAAKAEVEFAEHKTQIKAVLDLLWSKHDEDVLRLQALELRIASEHYVKRELDDKFDRLDNTFRQGMGELSADIKALSKTMVDCMTGRR